MFKHFDVDGFEFCSGRPGWSKRKTTNETEVTCKNCLKAMERARQEMDVPRQDFEDREMEAR